MDPVALLRTGGQNSKGQMSVIGWIRQLFESSEFRSLVLPPVHLMETIAEWYSMEMIHVIQEKEDHYAIPLRDIMASLVDEAPEKNTKKRKLDGIDNNGPNKKQKLDL